MPKSLLLTPAILLEVEQECQRMLTQCPYPDYSAKTWSLILVANAGQLAKTLLRYLADDDTEAQAVVSDAAHVVAVSVCQLQLIEAQRGQERSVTELLLGRSQTRSAEDLLLGLSDEEWQFAGVFSLEKLTLDLVHSAAAAGFMTSLGYEQLEKSELYLEDVCYYGCNVMRSLMEEPKTKPAHRRGKRAVLTAG